MSESILDSIKSMLGSDADYTVFDNEILVFINSAFSTLNQLGVGPSNGFMIKGSSETWADFLGDATRLESVKQYIFMKVKIGFDPPANSSVLSAYKDMCSELEWRLNVATDPGNY